MSGPKCGEISIDPAQWAASEAQSREELKGLAGLPHRTPTQEKRFQVLNKREEARKERQMIVYRSHLDRLNETISAQDGLKQQFQGIILPCSPSIPELDSSSAETITRCSNELASICDEYLKTTNLAVKQCQIRQKITEELRTHTDGIPSGVEHTAYDIRAWISSSEQLLARQQQEAYLKAAADKAIELLNGLQDEELSRETIESVDNIVHAACESDAQAGLKLLETQIAKDRDKIKKQERKKREIEEQQRQVEQRYRVAETIAAVLEDMGYESGPIDATAFAKDGRLYAFNNEWPSHALRFTIAKNGGHLVSEPVRIKESNKEGPSGQIRQEDVEVDKAWCSRDGIAELRKKSIHSGLQLNFRKEHEPGEVTLDVVSEDELGEELNRQRNKRVTPKEKALASRKLPR